MQYIPKNSLIVFFMFFDDIMKNLSHRLIAKGVFEILCHNLRLSKHP